MQRFNSIRTKKMKNAIPSGAEKDIHSVHSHQNESWLKVVYLIIYPFLFSHKLRDVCPLYTTQSQKYNDGYIF